MPRLIPKYHMAKVPTGTTPHRLPQPTTVQANQRVNKKLSVRVGLTGYKTHDDENRQKDKEAKYRHYSKGEPLYKAGRNEKCPCNSGLKFKHCCIDKKKVEMSNNVREIGKAVCLIAITGLTMYAIYTGDVSAAIIGGFALFYFTKDKI